jgi:hypothetical protein
VAASEDEEIEDLRGELEDRVDDLTGSRTGSQLQNWIVSPIMLESNKTFHINCRLIIQNHTHTDSGERGS